MALRRGAAQVRDFMKSGARENRPPRGVEKSMLIFEKESYECGRTHFRVSTVPRAPSSGSKPYFLQDLDDSGFEPNACYERIPR